MTTSFNAQLSVHRGVLSATALVVLLGACPVARAQGRLEVIPEVKKGTVELIRGEPKTVSMRVRNAGDADLPAQKIEFDYAADSKDKRAPGWQQPQVIGLEGVTLPKGASTNIAIILPAYPTTAEYDGQLFVTRQSPPPVKAELFHSFPIKVIEPNKHTLSAKVSGYGAAALAVGMLLLTMFIRVKDLNFFQSPDGAYSVSRFQVWFWTEVVLFSYAYLFFFAGSNIIFPDSVWGLLGISLGSTGIATGLASGKRSATGEAVVASTQAKKPKIGAIRDMLSEDGKPSMMRLQMFAWTIATGVFFLRQVWATETLWDVPTNLLILMGISHGGYLADKGLAPTAGMTCESIQPGFVKENAGTHKNQRQDIVILGQNFHEDVSCRVGGVALVITRHASNRIEATLPADVLDSGKKYDLVLQQAGEAAEVKAGAFEVTV